MSPPERSVDIFYVNWKGTAKWRHILPRRLYYGSNSFHKEPQWILEALDLDKKESRDFAMQNIHHWRTRDF
jgi:predicted DNA-binding transcriptional regulator YafY